MKLIKKLDKLLQSISHVFIAICILAMALIVTASVVCRMLHIQFTAADELARFVMIWAIFVGIIACTRHEGHVSVDVLPDLLKGKAQTIWKMLIKLVVIVTLFEVTFLCYLLVVHAWGSQQKAPITRIPYWFMYSSLVIGFGISMLREIELFVKKFILKKKDTSETDAEKEEK